VHPRQSTLTIHSHNTLPKADKEHTSMHARIVTHMIVHNVMTLFAEISARTSIPHRNTSTCAEPAGNTISTHVNGCTAEELSRPLRDLITHASARSSLRREQSERRRPGY
jgi:hypothetical protein